MSNKETSIAVAEGGEVWGVVGDAIREVTRVKSHHSKDLDFVLNAIGSHWRL